MNHQPLTLDQIRVNAPSVFANTPFPGVSGRYAFVSTASVVEQMMGEGWGVRQASQSFVRTDERKGYQKHMIRFTRLEDMARVNAAITHGNHIVNREKPLAEFPEVVMTNSHDGSASYTLHAGIFRLVCANGLVIADATFACLRVRHTGDANAIVAASYEVLEEAPRLMGQVEAMKSVMLTDGERTQFALGGAMLRYGFDKLEDCPIRYGALLNPRRSEDGAKTLWNTLNVVQENLVKGKQAIRIPKEQADDTVPVRRVRTHQLKAVDATMKVNKGVWEMAGALLASKQ